MSRRDNFYIRDLQNKDIIRETAIHEAGHAAAIYLGNKRKKLPSIVFRILINSWIREYLDCFIDNNELREKRFLSYF